MIMTSVVSTDTDPVTVTFDQNGVKTETVMSKADYIKLVGAGQ